MSSAEEKLIAGVLLAGWHIDDWAAPWGSVNVNRYRLWDPQGNIIGFHSTRYTAALQAERLMEYA